MKLIQIKLTDVQGEWFEEYCKREDRSAVRTATRIILEKMPQNYISNKNKVIDNNSNDYQQDSRYRELARLASQCDDVSLRSDYYDKMNEIQQEYKNKASVEK